MPGNLPAPKKPEPYELTLKVKFDSRISSDAIAEALASSVLGAITTIRGTNTATHTLRQGGRIVKIGRESLDAILKDMDGMIDKMAEKLSDTTLLATKIDKEIADRIAAAREADVKLQEELDEALSAICGC